MTFFPDSKFSRSSSSHRPIIIPEAMGHTGVGRVVIQGARCCPVSASQIPHIITSYYPLSFPLELGKQENQQGHPSFFGQASPFPKICPLAKAFFYRLCHLKHLASTQTFGVSRVASGLLYLMPCRNVPEAVLTAQGLPECRDAGAQPFPTDMLGVMAGSVLAPGKSRGSCAGLEVCLASARRHRKCCDSVRHVSQGIQCLQLCWDAVIRLMVPQAEFHLARGTAEGERCT